MKQLSIDIETYSSTNLNQTGGYRYADSDDFELLLFGYAVDFGPVKVVDLTQGEKIPSQIIQALDDPAIIKSAFNAQFERVCLSRFVGHRLKPAGWHCSRVWSATLGLPLSLRDVGTVLGLPRQKITAGKELVRYFCTSCKPTKANQNRTRNFPYHAPDKWQQFKQYNQRDVEVEMEITQKFSRFPVPQNEWENYWMDQDINDRGIRIDQQLVNNAIKCQKEFHAQYLQTSQQLTGLANPNSPLQLKNWLHQQGVETDSLAKASVAQLLQTTTGTVHQVLALRQLLSKSSVKKYQAMQKAMCKDGCVHGLLQFYGANRTGRWAGRLVQVQNLPRNSMPDLEEARALVKQGNTTALAMLYESVPDVLSQLIRTAFIPSKGHHFYVADFSAVEARVIAWLSGEEWRQAAFAKNEDIYCASASQMFGVPVVKHGINGELRQKGKIAELALGYGGSIGALKAMGATKLGLTDDELPPLVQMWRNASPHIVQFWWDVDKAAKECIKTHLPQTTHGMKFIYRSGCMFLRLRSGRYLCYPQPKIGINRFGSESITFMGNNTVKKWDRIETYGAKLVENIVQATSRDLLAGAMRRLETAGNPVVMHIHDEAVIDAPTDRSLDTIVKIMTEVPDWADGLILNAAGFVGGFYKKD
ncbi:DNA polymerase [Limosilactobacillus reuteri]|uniref:DNA-directed DNA polymerase n=4 Tax=Limosilactobacillus reuteri TaxID=1598 RepID=F8DMV7_LIMRS|nr:DNA polymerase [Limosilactobacillus reuteri]AEI56731.1 putative DNA-directed DNA polymerase [Limosilactobacillus reuteri SD2112]MCC4452760.1 DNA polymerase [Limosilactobacillus reuteri]MCC4459267.1 DNA polymerase [Limosilactobacillus reuteri]MCD9289111.1 DNA polymerase [Limosilactobacillus reuteri]UIT55313.1 DNA polymerase [Limosilactobacillus reuteri]